MLKYHFETSIAVDARCKHGKVDRSRLCHVSSEESSRWVVFFSF